MASTQNQELTRSCVHDPFTAVVIPIAMQHYLLLQRNLVYTGVTRGKQLVGPVGQRKALAIAVQDNKTVERCSGLLS